MDRPKTLIFDFDGTLHNTLPLYFPALQRTIHWVCRQKNLLPRKISKSFAASLLGYSPQQAWQILFPHMEEDILHTAIQQVGQEMNRALLAGQGELYPHAKETLRQLKERGYTMFLVSNSTFRYLHLATEVYGLSSYFDKIIAAETFHYTAKENIFRSLLHNAPLPGAAIGDRRQDMIAAEDNHMVKIFCTYGFGKEEEGRTADIQIDAVHRLQTILP